MNEHAGPACALSVLIVAAFAVLLHDKNPPPPPPPSAPRPQAREVTDAMPEGVKKVDGRSEARLERKSDAPAPPAPPPPSSKDLEMAEVPIAAPSKPEVDMLGAGGEGRRIEARPEVAGRSAPSGPKGPFTVVQPGESLVDVARRVYGSSDAAVALWKANRDQLERIDSTLARGTLLRTP